MEYYGVRTTGGLYHHGIKGMHWGIRRFQNRDGSLKSAGSSRYGSFGRNAILGKQRDYTSGSTKKFRKQGNTAAAKASAEFDKKITSYRRSQSMGKRFVKEYLMGPSAALTYDMSRINKHGRLGSFLRSAVDINVSSWAGNTAGSAASKLTKVKTGSAGAASVVGLAGRYGTDKLLTEKGYELSLQQRHQRNKYIINSGRRR